MNGCIVPGFVALIALVICISPVSAGTGSGNLTISSVTEDGGYLSAVVSTGEEQGYLTCWLNPVPGDCSSSHLLAWQYLPSGTGSSQIVMTGPVPYGITPGSYEIQVNYQAGDSIPDACDKAGMARATVVLSTPGTGIHDMAATLTGEKDEKSGPDYRIDAINGIDTTIRMTPSSTLSPVVTISNAGADDQSGLPVEVHAYLGSDELIPVTATTGPMKAGESRDVALSYLIPGSISQRSYPFFMIIDPRGVIGTADAATNMKRTGGQMMVRAEETDPIAEHGCGCA